MQIATSAVRVFLNDVLLGIFSLSFSMSDEAFDKGVKRKKIRCLSPVSSARAARYNVLMVRSLSSDLVPGKRVPVQSHSWNDYTGLDFILPT